MMQPCVKFYWMYRIAKFVVKRMRGVQIWIFGLCSLKNSLKLCMDRFRIDLVTNFEYCRSLENILSESNSYQ